MLKIHWLIMHGPDLEQDPITRIPILLYT